MKLKFQQHQKPNTVHTIKTVIVKTEKEAIKIVTKNSFPDGTTAIALENQKTGKVGYFYKNADGSASISWWSGHNWENYKNAFINTKSW